MSWNITNFGHVRKKIKTIKGELTAIKNFKRSAENTAKEKELSKHLNEWLAREELLWKQRSHSDWIKDGDKNTIFFRTKATKRRDKKFIEFLEMDDGGTITEQNQF